MKKWIARYNHPDRGQFIIESEMLRDVMSQHYHQMFCLLVFDAEGYLQRNHFQEEFEIVVEQALEDYGVPEDSWEEVQPGEKVPEK